MESVRRNRVARAALVRWFEVFHAPRKFLQSDDVTSFDCGKQSLNEWLKKFAWRNQQAGTSVTYVVIAERKVVAYYSIAVGSVLPNEATPRVAKGIGKFAIPILLLARLAVDRSVQARGIGYSLMQDVLIRTVGVGNEIGLRAIVVDALDEDARRFYLRYGFEPSPIDEMRLMLLMKDVRNTLGI